jgi:hypothetical protein
MIARGLSHEEAAVKAGLEGYTDATPVDVAPEVVAPVEVKHEVKPERKEEAKKGRVRVEVLVYLENEPMVLTYMTEMRGSLLKTQLNKKYLGDKFSEFLRSFVGRVDDVH